MGAEIRPAFCVGTHPVTAGASIALEPVGLQNRSAPAGFFRRGRFRRPRFWSAAADEADAVAEARQETAAVVRQLVADLRRMEIVRVLGDEALLPRSGPPQVVQDRGVDDGVLRS